MMEIVTCGEIRGAISFFIGGKNMRHIGEKIILVFCIVVFGIVAMNLVEIEECSQFDYIFGVKDRSVYPIMTDNLESVY